MRKAMLIAVVAAALAAPSSPVRAAGVGTGLDPDAGNCSPSHRNIRQCNLCLSGESGERRFVPAGAWFSSLPVVMRSAFPSMPRSVQFCWQHVATIGTLYDVEFWQPSLYRVSRYDDEPFTWSRLWRGIVLGNWQP